MPEATWEPHGKHGRLTSWRNLGFILRRAEEAATEGAVTGQRRAQS